MAFQAGTGSGLTLAFGTTTAYDAIQITSVSLDGITSEEIDVSHLGTAGFRDYIPGELSEGGSLSVEGVLDPNVPMLPVKVVETLVLSPNIVDSTHNTVGTVTFPSFVTSFSASYGTDDAMRFSATIKVAGDVVFVASSI